MQNLKAIMAFLVLPLFLSALLASTAYGDDDVMEFDLGDFDESPAGDGGGSDQFLDDLQIEGETSSDVDMAFGSDEPVLPRMVALVLRSGEAEEEVAFRLTQAISRDLRTRRLAEVGDPEEFRARLLAPGLAAALDCAANAVCVSGYGRDLWIEKILLGVLYKDVDGYKLNVNLVAVDSAEIEAYANPTLKGVMNSEQIGTTAQGVVKRLFNIRDASDLLDEGARKKLVPMRSPTQTKMAWVTGGLAVVATSVGIGYGVSSQNIENDILEKRGLTQVEAMELIENGKDHALYANILMATGLVAAVASTALFFIKPLQEVEVTNSRVSPLAGNTGLHTPKPSLFVLPSVGLGGAGLSAGLKF